MTTQLLTPAEAAAALSMHRKTVMGLIHLGELPSINTSGKTGRGARYRVSARDVDAYIRRHRNYDTATPARWAS